MATFYENSRYRHQVVHGFIEFFMAHLMVETVWRYLFRLGPHFDQMGTKGVPFVGYKWLG